jgi:hypothetical protein
MRFWFLLIMSMCVILGLSTRYGGTIAPCDDLSPCEVGVRTGFQVGTRLNPSGIEGAGLGRFVTEAVSAGTVIRTQIVGSPNCSPSEAVKSSRQHFPCHRI